MQNFIDSSGFRVKHHLVHQLDQQLAHAAERIKLLFAFTGAGQGIKRLVQAFEHGFDQRGLVVEVPVDRAAGHARQLGDIRQCGTRYPALIEGLLRSLKNLGAGFLGFFFGSTDHGSTTSSRPRHVYRHLGARPDQPLTGCYRRINFKACDALWHRRQGIYKQP
ncbi:hypothetical protein D3C81_1786160 [compost metagenome]